MMGDGKDRVLLAAITAAGAGVLVRALWKSLSGSAGSVSTDVKESTIRLMTRLAIQHGAVNLSQGFPNEPPPIEMSRAAAGALLGGTDLQSAELTAQKLEHLFAGSPERDLLSQYSFPFGLPLLRQELQAYYARFYPGLAANAEDNLTVTLGATEGFACVLRTICAPGDAVVFFEPFHELYPSQCRLWHLKPRSVTLYEDAGDWRFDAKELETALQGAKLLLMNTPHNPTGKVFTASELLTIAELCKTHDVVCATDDIYEHIVFDGIPRVPPHLALQAGMAERTFLVNAVSKTARATGWRVGWVVSPSAYTQTLRGVHDQLVLQAPTPLQFGAAAMLRLPDEYFAGLAQEYGAKRDFLLPVLREVGFRILSTPRGAYYIFADYTGVSQLRGMPPVAAAMKMTTEIGVACVPGDNFYLAAETKADPAHGSRYLRFAFVRSTDVLTQAAANLRSKMAT